MNPRYYKYTYTDGFVTSSPHPVMHSDLTLEEVNNLGYQAFIERFGTVVEDTPLVAATVWSQRPFLSVRSLHEAFCTFLTDLPSSMKAAVLRCCPDLGGRHAEMGAISKESTKEQISAGLMSLTVSEREELKMLNEVYKERFGFPFIMCSRENKKAAIIAEIRDRLRNTTEEELENAFAEISKVVRYRLSDIITDGSCTVPKANL